MREPFIEPFDFEVAPIGETLRVDETVDELRAIRESVESSGKVSLAALVVGSLTLAVSIAALLVALFS